MSALRRSREEMVMEYFHEADVFLADVIHEAAGRVLESRKQDGFSKRTTKLARARKANNVESAESTAVEV
jgi:hypothetical protein